MLASSYHCCCHLFSLSQIHLFFVSFAFQFIILASALCCTAFAYPVFEDYQYAGHDLSSHEGDSFDNGSYQPVAASRIGVHELGGHEDEHVDYYVCKTKNKRARNNSCKIIIF